MYSVYILPDDNPLRIEIFVILTSFIVKTHCEYSWLIVSVISVIL